MVLILPEEIWYSHVRSRDVPRIVEQHLGQGKPVQEMLYREFHPDRVQTEKLQWVWVMVGLSLLAMVGLTALGVVWAWKQGFVSGFTT